MSAPPPPAAPLLVVGLGNPGTRYTRTRHNVGEDWTRLLAGRLQVALSPSSRLLGETGEGLCGERRVRLFVPGCYVNESGGPVAGLIRKKGGAPQHTLVVHDEVDLPCGRMRLKRGGGTAGHNGLRSLEAALGSADFMRLRIGVGHPGAAAQMVSHVLGRPGPEERQLLEAGAEAALDAFPSLAAGDWEAACRLLHSP